MRNRLQFRALSLLCTLALLTGLLTAPASAADTPDAWAAGEVERAISLGLVPDDLQSGYTADITRAEFCRLAVICLDEAAAVNGWTFTPEAVTFDDTSDPDVLTAAGLGIVSGNGQGSFLPDKGITRQEAAVMLYNTLKVMGAPMASKGAAFTDQSAIASWAAEPVAAMVGWGVMNGTGGGAFSPQGSYSRQQAYVTIYRLLLFLHPPARRECGHGVLLLHRGVHRLLELQQPRRSGHRRRPGQRGGNPEGCGPRHRLGHLPQRRLPDDRLGHRGPGHHLLRRRLHGQEPHPLLQRRGLGAVPPD